MSGTQKIRVLVVDDSKVSRELLSWILSSNPGIEVIGTANDGIEAISMIATMKPDVVTMDIHMPHMDGYEATRQIMRTNPVPIIIASASVDPHDVAQLFLALEAGAVAAVEKPPGPADPRHTFFAKKIVDTVLAMSEVRVFRRRESSRVEAPNTAAVAQGSSNIRILTIGASTGGPPALHAVFAGLPKPFPVPIVLVQHIGAGFVQGLAEWLSATGIPTKIGQHGETASRGTAYLAPDNQQMAIASNYRITCTSDPAEHGLRPSASFLFRSVARNFGASAAGVLLTGMGIDGAEDLKLMRDAGAVTFAQDKESSVVHGMPGEAIRLNAATHVANPQGIAALLHALLGGQSGT